MGFVWFFPIIIGIIVIHELGHFVSAKLRGVKVLEFGLGYPPRLFGVRRGETIYSLNLLPLGGFVKMLGEEDPQAPGSLASQNIPTRLAVLGAGPLMNLALPFILLAAVFSIPQNTLVGEVTILRVAPDSPAEQAGLQPEDVVLRVNSRPIPNTRELTYNVQLNLGKRTTIQVRRGDQVEQVRVVPRYRPPAGEGPTGIMVTMEQAVVTAVEPGSVAAVAGLQQGDTLLYVKDERGPRNLGALVGQERLPESDLLVRRGDSQLWLHLGPTPTGANTGARVERRAGALVRRAEPVWRAVPLGARQVFDLLTLTKNGLVSSFGGTQGPVFAGPVGIAQATGEIVRDGGPPVALFWTAVLSLTIGIMNLLPLPALDGGRIAFVVLEFLRRGKRVSPQKEGLVHLVGFMLLMGLVLVISIFDIQRIIQGGSFLR